MAKRKTTYGGRPVLATKRRKGCSFEVKWVDDGRHGISAVLVDSRGRSQNVAHGYMTLPGAAGRRRMEAMLLTPACRRPLRRK